MRWEESDEDGGAREKKEWNTTEGSGSITSITTCRRENYQERTLKTGLNGGVS